mgnify:CR=1 FL=1
MLRLLMALQSVGGTDIPPDFDLQKVQPAPNPNAIVVTGRRRECRFEGSCFICHATDRS